MRVEWNLNVGVVGADHCGDIEVPDDATDDEIDAIVREEVFNLVSWVWERVAS